MANPGLEKANNDGQRDGANGEYEGTLDSGRTHEEQQAYNNGHTHGQGTRDGADGEYKGTLDSGRTYEEQQQYNKGYESGRRK